MKTETSDVESEFDKIETADDENESGAGGRPTTAGNLFDDRGAVHCFTNAN